MDNLETESMMFTQVLDVFELLNSTYDSNTVDTLDMALTKWYLSEHTKYRKVYVTNLDKLYLAGGTYLEDTISFCKVNGYKFNLSEFKEIGFIPDILARDLTSLSEFKVFIPEGEDSLKDTIKKVDGLIRKDFTDRNGKLEIIVDINTEINPGDLSIIDEIRELNLYNFKVPNNAYYSMIESRDAIDVVNTIKDIESRHGKYDKLVIDNKNFPRAVSEREIQEVVEMCYMNGIECDLTMETHGTMSNIYGKIYSKIKTKMEVLLKECNNQAIVTNGNFSTWYKVEIDSTDIQGRDGIVIKETTPPITMDIGGFNEINIKCIEKISPQYKFIPQESIDKGEVKIIPASLVHDSGVTNKVNWKYVFS